MTHSALVQRVRQKIDDKTTVVGVIGLGYVGLPLLVAFHDAGARVIGFDIDPVKIAAIARGENYLPHLGEGLLRGRAGASFESTADMSRLGECDALLICVPTPLGPHREPDLSFVVGTAASVGRVLRPGQIVVLESSTYPGTTRHELLGALLDARRAAGGAWTPTLGADLFVAFSPEREDPGRQGHTTRTIPKIVGGLDDASTTLAAALYAQAIEKVIPVRTAEVAETAKLLENIFRGVNIALVNELKVVLDAMGIDIWEVIAAASSKPFGFMPFYPGPGLGGHCIPIDPFYLAWKAKEVGQTARFIELAGEVNHAMPRYVVDKLVGALNARGRAVRGSRILVLGLAYKPDIADVRESPALELIELLGDLGAHVEYSDPHVPRTHRMRRYDLKLESVSLSPSSVASYDALLLATHHRAFDYAMIAQHARLVVDTRNALRAFATQMGDRLVRA